MPDPSDSTPAPRTLSEQDEALLREVTAWERSLIAARDDAEVQDVIGPAGFGPDDLAARLELVAAAGKKIEDRAEAMAVEDRLVRAKQTLFEQRRADYALFRKIVRPLFRRDEAALTALNLHGDVPDAFDLFVTEARTAYANAAKAPYAEQVARRNYKAARLTALRDDLAALVKAAADATDAEARAVEATGARDLAAQAAGEAYAEYRDTVRPLLSGFPELRRRLGL